MIPCINPFYLNMHEMFKLAYKYSVAIHHDLIYPYLVPTIPPQANITTTNEQGEITALMPPSEQTVTQSHQCTEDLRM